MAKLIIIKTTGDFIKASNSLNKMKHKLPQMTRIGMRRWGKILERDLKMSARQAGIKSHTNILLGKGIEWRQGKNSNVGYLFMRLYGIQLDEMRPHYVALRPRRTRLMMWARQASSSRIRQMARDVDQKKSKRAVYVKPHPFIAKGYRRARGKLSAVLKRAAKRAVERRSVYDSRKK